VKILAIGDVVGKNGIEFLRLKLKNFRAENNIDFVIANGENSAEGNGILPVCATNLFESGVDVITGGNHSFRRREVFPFLGGNHRLIRPFNYPKGSTPGSGICKILVGNTKIGIINLMGVVYLESLRSPFEAVDEAIEICKDCKVKIVDFHAEATAEKRALGYYVDSRVSIMFGTHTHVQTSDEEILPRGTGYITDVGMTGTIESVLGVKKEISIKRMKNKIPIRFENAQGACKMEGIIFEVDENSGKTISLKRLRLL